MQDATVWAEENGVEYTTLDAVSSVTPMENTTHFSSPHTYVMQGFEELRGALEPIVATAYGAEWRVKATNVLNEAARKEKGKNGKIGYQIEPDEFEDDAARMLRVIKEDPGTFPRFSRGRGKALVNDLIWLRNKSHHNQNLKVALACRTYDCFSEFFELIGHSAPHIEANGATLHGLAKQAAQARIASNDPTSQADGEQTGAASDGARADRSTNRDGPSETRSTVVAAAPSAADTTATDSRDDSGDRGATDHQDDSANGGTRAPWVAADEGGDEAPVVRIFKKKRLIAVAVIGFLTTLALIQLKTSQNAPPPPPPPSAPEVASISPPMPTAQPNAQTVRLSGRGFRTGLKVVLEVPGGGSSILSGTHIQDLIDTSFAVVGAPLTVQGRYALSVENSDSSKSNLFVFTVASSPRRDTRPEANAADRNASPGLATTASKPSTAIAPPATPIMTTASNGFRYDLESCTASGTTVRCIFAVTNQEDDRELMVVGSARDRNGVIGSFAASNAGIPGTRAIDDSGNYATMREARLANYGSFGGTLIPGVRTRLVVVFEGISASAQTLSVLDLGSSIGSRGVAFGIQFRDVPLGR